MEDSAIELGIKVHPPKKKTKRGFYLYDIVKESKHKILLQDVKEFLKKYYTELSYSEITNTVKALFNVNLTTNDIKNLCLGLGLKPKNLDSSTRKFSRKQFHEKVSRGLWLCYFDFRDLSEIKLKPS